MIRQCYSSHKVNTNTINIAISGNVYCVADLSSPRSAAVLSSCVILYLGSQVKTSPRSLLPLLCNVLADCPASVHVLGIRRDFFSVTKWPRIRWCMGGNFRSDLSLYPLSSIFHLELRSAALEPDYMPFSSLLCIALVTLVKVNVPLCFCFRYR